jgi:hypothetical protein
MGRGFAADAAAVTDTDGAAAAGVDALGAGAGPALLS